MHEEILHHARMLMGTPEDQYLYALASEKVRSLIDDYRDRQGMDKDIGGPAPRPMLIELLVSMHHTATNALASQLNTEEVEKDLSPWLLPIQPANLVYAPEVLRACDTILAKDFKPALSSQDILDNLQKLFDSGREAGADEETIRAHDEKSRVEARIRKAISDPFDTTCGGVMADEASQIIGRQRLGAVRGVVDDYQAKQAFAQNSAQRATADPQALKSYWEEQHAAQREHNLRSSQAVEQMKPSLERETRKCWTCGNVGYADEPHYCPADAQVRRD